MLGSQSLVTKIMTPVLSNQKLKTRVLLSNFLLLGAESSIFHESKVWEYQEAVFRVNDGNEHSKNNPATMVTKSLSYD